MTNNNTYFSKLRNDLITKFEYIPKDPKYISMVYKLIENNIDIETIFIESVGYHCPMFNSKFNIVPNAVESVYNKILAADNVEKLSNAIIDISTDNNRYTQNNYMNLWFSMFKELYDKQDNSIDKLKAVLSMVNFFTFCFDLLDEGYYDEAEFRRDIINIKNEFIESVHTYYYK